MATKLGLDYDMILPVVNLVQQQKIEPKAAHLILEVLCRLLDQADCHFENVQTGKVARGSSFELT